MKVNLNFNFFKISERAYREGLYKKDKRQDKGIQYTA